MRNCHYFVIGCLIINFIFVVFVRFCVLVEGVGSVTLLTRTIFYKICTLLLDEYFMTFIDFTGFSTDAFAFGFDFVL